MDTNPNETSSNPLARGVRTSEFWVTVAALLLPFVFSVSNDYVMRWTAAHGWIGELVAAMFVAGRSYVKGSAVRGPQ